MAQMVASRPIHSSLACPTSRSTIARTKKIHPSLFSSRTPLQNEAKKNRGCFRILAPIAGKRSTRAEPEVISVSPEDVPKIDDDVQYVMGLQKFNDTFVGMWSNPTVRRKTKIVCTIRPSADTKEMIWKLVEADMNVARMNMSQGDHVSHQKVIDLVKEYNAQAKTMSLP